MTSPASPTSGPRSGRDPMLDLWRGLALLDMAWVHLANHPIGLPAAPAMWIGEYTRFAAGCLVLLSGMTVGHVFGPALRAGGNRARSVRVRLWRRAVLLAAVGRLASIAYLTLDLAMRGFPGGVARLLSESASLATFAAPGATGGLLLLYALLLAAVPWIERFRARWGTDVTMATSVALFLVAQLVGPAAQMPPWVFPVPHWQPLFVAGYLAAPHLGLLREHDNEAVRGWRAATTVAFAAMFAVRSAPALGLESAPLPFVEFRKVPLSAGELLWYTVASAAVLTWSAWLYDRSGGIRRATGWILRMGRWSLLVYVAHLLLEPPILLLVDATRASPEIRGFALVGIAVAMGAVAWAADLVDNREAARSGDGGWQRLRNLVPTSGVVGSGVATAAWIGILVLRTALPSEPVQDRAGDVHELSPGTDEDVEVLEFAHGSETDAVATDEEEEEITRVELDLGLAPEEAEPASPSLDDLAIDPSEMPIEQ